MPHTRSFVFASVFLAACGSSDTPANNGAGGAGSSTSAASSTTTSATTATTASGTPCASGETTCGAACITGTDCDHAVAVDGSSNVVYVNGGRFLLFDLASASDVTQVHVADALVAFHAKDATHLLVEIPPGLEGNADVTLATANGSVVTKRALRYRKYTEGTAWTTKTMAVGRGGFPAMATTSDDRALVAGGYTAPDVADCTDTADLYDRTKDTMVAATSKMSTARWTATATTVLDGTTIVAGSCYQLGGCPSTIDPTAIDRFDPATNGFTKTKGVLTQPRSYLRNQLLADGRVLYASQESPPFDLYDPASDTTTASNLLGATGGLLARLRDGRVLVVPGNSVGNTIYDPATDTVTPTGDSLARGPDALVVVGDGRVFAIGGVTISAGVATFVADIDVFDPVAGKFTPWGWSLKNARGGATSVLARDGFIYVIGGLAGTDPVNTGCAQQTTTMNLDSVEILNPDAKSDADTPLAAGPTLPAANNSLRSTVLFDGSILAAGGTACGVDAGDSFSSVYFLEAPPDPLK